MGTYRKGFIFIFCVIFSKRILIEEKSMYISKSQQEVYASAS